MAIKKGDFIEINYTGFVKDTNEAFDTTNADIAKEQNIFSPKTSYEPVIVVIGERHVIRGLDEGLVGKDVGKHSFEIADVDAFGKKDPKKMQLVPMKVFTKENIKPFAGLQVNFDNQIGTVRSVSGGRVIVDFNHPLSSKEVKYDVDILRIVDDKAEQVKAFFTIVGLPVEKVEMKDGKAVVDTKQPFPKQFVEQINNDVKRLTDVEVEFSKVMDLPKAQEK